MTTFVYCSSCDKEAPRSFFCSKCKRSYCEDCVSKAKDEGNGYWVFRCDSCGAELLFPLPMPAPPPTLDEFIKGLKDPPKPNPSPVRAELQPRRRAAKSRGVKRREPSKKEK